ncbi:Ca2+-binding protein, EF-hand superfamily [Rhodovulum sp. ES.010]|uniref:EF-hand domain-containing protein n=1 Tax=Rhodovulum sp. ES.010 TaxID=1882821 RepID=UPI00092945DB|nr:hypothetical protein [Rhodovulum sp. ES.010]SIO32177.1 Ca2+-binding protein, EF-hand superfamily [Rhodovulum sp. ES.010]
MTKSKFVPAGLLALVLVGGTAPLASAQGMSFFSDRDAKAMRADFRGGDHGQRGHHAKRSATGGGMFRTLFEIVDANGDRSVTEEEIDAYRAAQLAEVDASGDGALSIEEFDKLYRALTRSRMVDAFQALDADGDGRIAAEEIDTRIAHIVARLDRDGDGVLSLTPPAAAPVQVAPQADN